MSAEKIKTEQNIIDKLKEIKCIRIPTYQRSYRWTHIQCHALLKTLGKKDFNFISYVMVSPDPIDKDTYDLVDGQQRLTSISLLIKSMKKNNIKISNFLKTVESALFNNDGSYKLKIESSEKNKPIVSINKIKKYFNDHKKEELKTLEDELIELLKSENKEMYILLEEYFKNNCDQNKYKLIKLIKNPDILMGDGKKLSEIISLDRINKEINKEESKIKKVLKEYNYDIINNEIIKLANERVAQNESEEYDPINKEDIRKINEYIYRVDRLKYFYYFIENNKEITFQLPSDIQKSIDKKQKHIDQLHVAFESNKNASLGTEEIEKKLKLEKKELEDLKNKQKKINLFNDKRRKTKISLSENDIREIIKGFIEDKNFNEKDKDLDVKDNDDLIRSVVNPLLFLDIPYNIFNDGTNKLKGYNRNINPSYIKNVSNIINEKEQRDILDPSLMYQLTSNYNHFSEEILELSDLDLKFTLFGLIVEREYALTSFINMNSAGLILSDKDILVSLLTRKIDDEKEIQIIRNIKAIPDSFFVENKSPLIQKILAAIQLEDGVYSNYITDKSKQHIEIDNTKLDRINNLINYECITQDIRKQAQLGIIRNDKNFKILKDKIDKFPELKCYIKNIDLLNKMGASKSLILYFLDLFYEGYKKTGISEEQIVKIFSRLCDLAWELMEGQIIGGGRSEKNFKNIMSNIQKEKDKVSKHNQLEDENRHNKKIKYEIFIKIINDEIESFKEEKKPHSFLYSKNIGEVSQFKNDIDVGKYVLSSSSLKVNLFRKLAKSMENETEEIKERFYKNYLEKESKNKFELEHIVPKSWIMNGETLKREVDFNLFQQVNGIENIMLLWSNTNGELGNKPVFLKILDLVTRYNKDKGTQEDSLIAFLNLKKSIPYGSILYSNLDIFIPPKQGYSQVKIIEIKENIDIEILSKLEKEALFSKKKITIDNKFLKSIKKTK